MEAETVAERLEREAIEAQRLAEEQARDQIELAREEAARKVRNARLARLKADWKRIHTDSEAEAAALAVQREKDAKERAALRSAKAEMNSLFGFTVAPVSIFDDEDDDLHETAVRVTIAMPTGFMPTVLTPPPCRCCVCTRVVCVVWWKWHTLCWVACGAVFALSYAAWNLS